MIPSDHCCVTDLAQDEDKHTIAREYSLNALRRDTTGEGSFFRMEKKPIEARPLSWEQPSPQHWIASFGQILLILSLLAYVLLVGSFFSDVVSFSSSRSGITNVEAVALVVSVLLSVVLCIVSGTAYAFARAWQWRDGRKLAMRGLLVGGIGFFLVGGVLLITFFIEQSKLAPA